MPSDKPKPFVVQANGHFRAWSGKHNNDTEPATDAQEEDVAQAAAPPTKTARRLKKRDQADLEPLIYTAAPSQRGRLRLFLANLFRDPKVKRQGYEVLYDGESQGSLVDAVNAFFNDPIDKTTDLAFFKKYLGQSAPSKKGQDEKNHYRVSLTDDIAFQA